jgi:hypothetical protein
MVFASLRVGAQGAASPRGVTIYKDPTCGCCTKWSELLRQSGFTVTIRNLSELDRSKYAVPAELNSCHTAVVDGHLVVGHVPMADIQRMLKQGAATYGLAVPGMPIGSPGMEVPGVRAQAFNVIAFDKAGKSRVFASYGGA